MTSIRIGLNLKGVAYDSVDVSLLNGDQQVYGLARTAVERRLREVATSAA